MMMRTILIVTFALCAIFGSESQQKGKQSRVAAGAAEPSPKKDEKGPKIQQVQPEIADLTGYYTCKGQEAGGKNYSGICTLVKKGDVYLISWVVGGGSSFSGIAIRQGSQFAASWSIATEKGLVRGVNLYRIEAGKDGPRLVGRWASVPGPGVQQPETLTFLKKLDTDDDEK
ncbi:hypothetical protein HZA87_06020 [Candidatus Uhrbacteria bacterium]|nr:hypothetical protein [Candidatus Uhrbacteria bacterium]